MSSLYLQHDRSRLATFALVMAMHAVGGYLLLLHAPTRAAVKHASAIMVMLIREQPRTVPLPAVRPKPLPPLTTRPEPVAMPPIVTNGTLSDASVVVPAVAVPLPVVNTTSAQPAAIVPPQFDADYLDNPAPAYPALSRRLSEAGRVVLRVFVDAGGNARQIEIHTSSRFERLDQAAVDAVRRWRFAAARLGEQPVAAWVLVPVNFSLRG